MTTGKTAALTTFVGKVMPLLFNVLSRFVIAFLARSKRLLISWLQKPFAVILEPKEIGAHLLVIQENLRIKESIASESWFSGPDFWSCYGVGREAEHSSIKAMSERSLLSEREMFQAFQWHSLLLTCRSGHKQESRGEEKSTSGKSPKRFAQLFLSQTALCIWKTASLLSIYKIALIFYENGKGFSFLF